MYSDEHFYYQEKRKAAYVSVHRDWDRCSIKAGLRYEHIDLGEKGHINHNETLHPYVLNDDILHRNYWLPSFSFSFKPKGNQQIALTWGTDCIHPNFYDLNNLRIYKTGYEFFQGDPTLLPSRTSDIELSYHNHKGFYACAYHHHASDVVVRNTQLVPWQQTEEYQLNRVAIIPENKGRSNQYGLYLRYQNQVSPSLLLTAEGEACYHDFRTPQIMYNATEQYIFDHYGWGERLAITADLYLNRQHTLLLNARYQHWFSDHTGMTKTDSYGYSYFALRYSLLDDRLRLSLVANDPFRQYVTDETNYSGLATLITSIKQMIQYSHTNHHAHYIGFTVSYAFGGQKVRRIQHDRKDTESQRAIRKQ